ncbi:MAG: DUF1003 domain-containing protein [Methylobacteriaceae bacterium]|nr:DUF1003 domain-containing protein [Methylobacteriaceae bacterium]
MNSEIRYLAQHLLHAGVSPLSERDRRVIQRVARRMHVARDVNQVFEDRLTMGQRLADRVATIGGSWAFIVGFGVFLGVWALINMAVLAENAFDPYPFVFLNLLLSMLAALQAPVIMMSQNRQAAKDRLAAALDYEVNVKAETAISELHDKVDRLGAQVEQLVALQQDALRPAADAARPALRVV